MIILKSIDLTSKKDAEPFWYAGEPVGMRRGVHTQTITVVMEIDDGADATRIRDAIRGLVEDAPMPSPADVAPGYPPGLTA